MSTANSGVSDSPTVTESDSDGVLFSAYCIVDPPCGAATDLVGVRMRFACEWAFRGGALGECTAAFMPPCPIAGGRVGFIARTAASGQEPISAHMSSVCKLFFFYLP